VEVSQAIRLKRAVRSFTPQPLPEPALRSILNAGRRAQSAKNRQAWHFLVIRDRQSLEGLSKLGKYAGHLAGAAAAFRGPFFIAVSVLAIAVICYYHARYARGRPLSTVGLALILGGALGNLIDRLRVGMVIDFLDFYLGAYHWPAFNVADSGITVGVGLLLVEMLRERGGNGRGAAGAS